MATRQQGNDDRESRRIASTGQRPHVNRATMTGACQAMLVEPGMFCPFFIFKTTNDYLQLN